LAVVKYEDKLLICDSYNHKLKFVYPKSNYSLTWVGSHKSGFTGYHFNEPSGLAVG